ncbi:DegT/DnrJ/EryC1/StrS family aminotransferase [Paraferrimonas sedimenticola]|uniref:Aminotransferase n=1 Tax=Paraferrimonas sedimenticola TaxID=375674 RepID=A0AA37W1G0_9GAMM|nr:DegT/DnrJ/EryC1/StrS family aminotransferase [Paraferrimonas sedimenticola]GLP96748.1 aminotransferase [Paraferrimonas sedimenticola]
MVRFLDLDKVHTGMGDELWEAVQSVVKRSAFIGGSEIKEFEQAFAEYQQAEHCVGVANGTDALEIAIEALDLPANSEIIVPANSFVASSEAVTRAGHKVVFCDCNDQDMGIDLDSIAAQITDKTAAIVVVHLYGHPADMDGVLALANQHGLKIVEDCAQAHGTEYKGRRIGAIGDVGTFSFYPGKNLGAWGDAGAVLTNDKSIAERVRMIANHGRLSKYDHEFEGRNSRMDTLQAAVLGVKLKHLEKAVQQRIAIADTYLAQLSDITSLVLPTRQEWARQAYHLFVVRTEQRDALKQHLTDSGVASGIHYPIALPKLQAYDYLTQDTSGFKACQMDTQLLSLPIGEHMTNDDVERVVVAVRSFFENGQA